MRKDGARTRHVGTYLGPWHSCTLRLAPLLLALLTPSASRQQPSARSAAHWTGSTSAAPSPTSRRRGKVSSVHGSRRRGWDNMPPLAFIRSLPARSVLDPPLGFISMK